MKTRVLFVITVVLALSYAWPAFAESGKPRTGVPEVPANLLIPAGHKVFLETRAAGTQNYICLPSTTGVEWRFLGPQATLFMGLGRGRLQLQVATHFLSANPAEGGTARATWQHSLDSSLVWARAIASSTDSNYVAAGAIPWLLLEATGTSSGPSSGWILSQTSFIHRVNTEGGVAPATGCTNTNEIGVVAMVPYRTDYFFYRKAR